MRDYDGVPRYWPAKVPPKRLLLALALLGCVALMAGSIAYAMFADRRNAWHAAEMAASKAQRSSHSTAGKYSRPQLVAMLNGKSTREVISLIGEPDSITNNSFPNFIGSKNWHYTRLSFDPVTLQPDNEVILSVTTWRVVSVSFY